MYIEYKNLFCCIRRIYSNVGQQFNYTPYLFFKKWFKSEITSFCIWTQKYRNNHITKAINYSFYL
jgi:hypothetical protein